MNIVPPQPTPEPITPGASPIASTAGAPAVYSSKVIGWMALMLSFPGGIAVSIRNWCALDQRRAIKPHLIAVVVVALLLSLLLLFASDRAVRPLVIATNAAAFYYFRLRAKNDLSEYAQAHPETPITFLPWYRAAAWALLGLLAYFLMFIALGVGLELAGVEVPE